MLYDIFYLKMVEAFQQPQQRNTQTYLEAITLRGDHKRGRRQGIFAKIVYIDKHTGGRGT